MVFQFSAYTLDPDRRLLLRDGNAVVLTPKVFQTLLVLVQNHDRVMSKDELCRLIWPDQFVEEANLTQNISVLRRTLDGVEAGKKHIVTFHGHGYRFVEPVIAEELPRISVPDNKNGRLSPPLAISSPTRETEIKRAWRRSVVVAGGSLLLSATIFAARAYLRRPASVVAKPFVPAVPGIETITRLQGAQFEPAWSPDGNAFAFVNCVGDAAKSSVYIQRKGEMQPSLIVSAEGQYNSPAWSPDGHFLAAIHVRSEEQEIVIFDLSHKTQRKLTRLFPHRYGLEYRHLDWSPDGTMLVVDDKETETDPLSLYLVHLDNGAKVRLTYPTMDIIGDVAPRFSPDGSKIAFVRIKYQGQNSVFCVPVTGGEAVKVIDPATLISDVDWETEDRILFTGRLDDKFRFWRQSLRNAEGKPFLALPIGTDTPLQFTLQRTSGKIAYSAYNSNLNIWRADITGSKTWKPIIMSPGQDVSPAFSPDGKRIVFRSDIGGRERLWVSDVDGSNAHVVDTGGVVPAVHTWDADSKTILFNSRYSHGLFAVDASGSKPVTQITTLELSHPARSIEGNTIFARTGPFVFRFYRKDRHVEKLTVQGGSPLMESSDGRYLYFAQGRMETKIARLDLRTKQQQTIISALLPGYNESWALTKNGIYFLAEQNGRPVISFHNFDTRKEYVVTSFPGDLPPVGDSGFTVSPGGETLLVVRAEPVASNIQQTFLHDANYSRETR